MERLEKENYEFLASILLSRNTEGESVLDHLCNTGTGRHREQNLYIVIPHQNQANKRMAKESSERKV